MFRRCLWAVALVACTRREPASRPPTADFSISGKLLQHMDVTLDASASRAPDGTIVGYQWSVFFDETHKESFRGLEPTVVYAFAWDGRAVLALQVTDDSGQKNSTEQLVTITAFAAGQIPGVLDCMVQAEENDQDQDGLFDACDNCPTVDNASQEDADGDTQGDACDACPHERAANDIDGDCAPDATDNCPLVANADQAQSDTDALGDACDACPNVSVSDDRDGDCRADTADNCPDVGNSGQEDEDHDGVGDVCDPCPQTALSLDTDGDCIPVARDNCPLVANADQADLDDDELGDACDACPETAAPSDTDGDCVPDATDNCPTVANADQAQSDADGLGDACDNCPSTTNPGQEDHDEDGIGTACDTGDTDHDGRQDRHDNCPETPNFDQRDGDQDGDGDACDVCPEDARNDVDSDGHCANVDNCPFVANPGQEAIVLPPIGDACATPQQSSIHPWPMPGHDPQNTRRSGETFLGEPPFQERTIFSGNVYGDPALGMFADQPTLVLVSTADNAYTLRAVQEAGELWYLPLVLEGLWPLAFRICLSEDGTTFLNVDDQVLAVNSTGDKLWQRDVGYPINAMTIGPDATIYALTSSSHVYLLRPDGSVVRSLTLPWSMGTITAPGLSLGGSELYAAMNGKLVAFDASEGAYTKTWSLTGGGRPAIGADSSVFSVVAQTGSASLRAFSSTGVALWQKPLGTLSGLLASFFSPAAVGPDGTLIAVSLVQARVSLSAFSPHDGSPAWPAFSLNVAVTGDSSPVVTAPSLDAAGTIYWVNYDQLYAVRADGTQSWQYSLGQTFPSLILPAADALYLVAYNGVLRLSAAE